MTNGIIDSGQEIVTNGLVLHLDAAQRRSYSGTGTTWTDLSGNGNNGTLTNGPTFNSANGGSIQFDGTNDHVNMGDILNNVFSGTNVKYSFNVWLMFNSLNVNTNYTIFNKSADSAFSENQRLMALVVRDITASNFNGIQVEFLTFFDLTSSNYRGVRTLNANLKINTLYNIQLTFDSTINTNDGLDRVKIYINGQLQNTTFSFTAGTLSSTFLQSTCRLGLGAAIGTNPISTPIALLNGIIYNASVYNRVLSDTEILQNYNATKARFEVPALLDLYPNAAAAYSLRKLRSGYTGSAIRVRRSSDNTEQDIGFTSTGDLDITALTTFVGANNGFVTTWYDQSGNNRNATQATTTAQPEIVNAGTIITLNSKPVIRALTDRYLTTSSTFFNNTMYSTAVGSTAATTTESGVWPILWSTASSSGVNGFGYFQQTGTASIIRAHSGNLNYNGNSATTNGALIQDKLFLVSNLDTVDNTSAKNIVIFNSSPYSGTNWWKGTITEAILYGSDQSANRIGIETNINSYYGIYNPTVVTIDTDAQAFITAAGITDLVQQGAINTLVQDLKTANIWPKMKAIYPFVGGTASTHKFNLKDPRDLDAANRLVFNGTWTHTSSGADPGGGTTLSANPFILFSELSMSSFHWSYYSTETLVNEERVLWAVDTTDFFEVYSGNRYYASSPVGDVIAGNSRAFHLMNRQSSSFYNLYRNSTKVATILGGPPNSKSSNVWLGYMPAYAIAGSTMNCAFASIGSGLTDTDAANLYTAVQKYQTTLGRQV